MQTLKRAIIILSLLIPFSLIFLPTATLPSLFSIQSAEAYTYQDVENWLSANPAPQGCEVYVETVTGSVGKSYKIHWKCVPMLVKQTEHYVLNGTRVNKWDPYHGTLPVSLYNCDASPSNRTGTYTTIPPTGNQYIDVTYYVVPPSTYETRYVYCDDSYFAIPSTWWAISWAGLDAVPGSGACRFYVDVFSSVSCDVTDTVKAEFFPVDECEDKDSDGITTCDGDCNDNDPTNTKTTPDKDGDGVSGCEDCNNNDPAIYPGAKEKCDGKDNNCNGDIDEGACDCSVELNLSSSANAANGSLSHSQTLLQTPNSKLKTDFTLFYNSLYSGSGHLGTGWSHSYDITLKEFTNGSILFREGNNRRLYTFSGGNYINQAGDYSTLVRNLDGAYLLTKKDGQKYIFNSAGMLTKIEDRLGNTMTFAYGSTSSPGQLLTEITDSVGRKTTLSYDSNNRFTQLLTPNSQLTTFSYNSSGYLTAVTDSAGYSWTYTYDSNGRMLTKVDTEGNIITYAYDSQGRVISSTDSAGQTKTISYTSPLWGEGGVRGQTTITERDGGVWSYTYDASNGTLTEKTDPQGNTTTYQYDSSRNLIKETAPDGSTTTYTYDTNGNMASQTDAMGNTTTYAYNSFNQLTQLRTPNSELINYSYDTYGNLTSVTDLSGGITQFNYDSKGNITRITSPNGGVTVYEYDSYNNLTKITGPNGNTTSFTYDSTGNMTSMTDSQGNTTRFEYNSLNQLIRVIDSSGNVTEYSFDSRGNKTSQTDANGNTTFYEYNHNSKLTKVIDALGNATNYTYGGTGGCQSCGSGGGDNLTSITDAKGQVTIYQYDTLGRLTKETDPLGNSITYSYDSKGNLISKTDANGATVNYTYDSLGRLTKKKYPDNTEETFTYDAKGNIITATNHNISYTFTYDASGKPLTVTDSYGRVIKYEYDTAGNKTKMITPEGKEINYTYDISHRLTQIFTDNSPYSPFEKGGLRGIFSFTYDTAGRRTKLTYPNGVTTTYTYDSIGRLTNLLTQYTELKEQGKKKPPILKLHTLDSYTYTHDKVGNRLSKTEMDKRYDYSYDTIYRLLQSTPIKIMHNGREREFEHKAETFTYDPVGNRLTGPKEKLSYTYNTANQLTELLKQKRDDEEKRTEYTYDNNGNLTKKIEYDDDGNIKTITLYTYDYENRLVMVIKQEEDETKTVSFKYDSFGRRIEKRVEEIEDGKVKIKVFNYVYDNEDIILEYLTKTEDEKTKTETTRYTHGLGIDEPLAIEQKGKAYYYHLDGLGSVTALTDGKSKVVQRYDYDSFGKLKRHGNKVKNSHTYTAREYDKETGLYYHRARYYDAKVGRFLQQDPFRGFLRNPQTLNRYPYVGNNPVKFVDPWGLQGDYPFEPMPWPESWPTPEQFYTYATDKLQQLTNIVAEYLTDEIINSISPVQIFVMEPVINYLNPSIEASPFKKPERCSR